MASLAAERPFSDWGASERNLWHAAFLTAVLIFVFAAFGWAEKHLLELPRAMRLIGNGAEAATRTFTIPHVIVGFLFMLTAARNRNAPRRLLIAALLGCGAALSIAYGQVLGQYGRRLAELLLYSYFLIHELRDEASFYRLLDDGPKPAPADKRFRTFVNGLIAVILAVVFVSLWVSYAFRPEPELMIPGLSASQMLAAGLALSFACLGAGWALMAWYGRGSGLDAAGVFREHRRLFRLFGAVLLVTVLGALLTGRLFAVVLLHVAVWYVFTCRHLKERPPAAPPKGLWPWMRGTLTGFRVLHLGLAAALVLICLAAAHGFEPAGPLYGLLTPEALPYWTIIHITVSFVPR